MFKKERIEQLSGRERNNEVLWETSGYLELHVDRQGGGQWKAV